jgi:pSer/pThr/pTyr-binding forkhead associated (FHA) protein
MRTTASAGKLEVTLEDGQTFTHDLTSDQTNLGRGEECELRLPDENASRLHAVISLRADGYWVSDLGSLNGVLVNGKKVESAYLIDGDRITIGSCAVVFRQPPPAERAESSRTAPPEGARPEKERREPDAAERSLWLKSILGAFLLGAFVAGAAMYVGMKLFLPAPGAIPLDMLAPPVATAPLGGQPRAKGQGLGDIESYLERAEQTKEGSAALAEAGRKREAERAAEKAETESLAREEEQKARAEAAHKREAELAAEKAETERQARAEEEKARAETARKREAELAAEKAETERRAREKEQETQAEAARKREAERAAEKAETERQTHAGEEKARAETARKREAKLAAEKAETERQARQEEAPPPAVKEREVQTASEAAGKAPAAGTMSGRQIMDEQKKRHDVDSEYAESTLVLVDETGGKEQRVIKAYMKDMGNDLDRSLIVFLEPATVRGTALLTWQQKDRDDDQWLYLPSQKKLQRIAQASKRSYFMGTDFTYEDNQTEQLDDYQYTVLRSEEVDGHDCWVIESLPVSPKKKQESGYSKRNLWIRKDIYFGVKIEYYDRRGRHIKTQTSYKLVNVQGSIWRPSQTLMDNYERNHKTLRGTRTQKINLTIDGEVFTERYIQSEKHLD